MGERWSINQYGGITRDGCFLSHNEIPVTANTDCDAYEKRIAELEAKVDRVKAESLRVVVDGEPCLLDDSGPFFMLYEGAVYSYGEHNAWYEVSDPFRCCHASPAATVTPVRLERWETEE